jgi:uridylate kinase
MQQTTVLSLGGSILAPDKVDTRFLADFKTAVDAYLERNDEHRIILVTGGGAPARIYQEAYRLVADNAESDAQDWIGVAATHLNGTLVRAVFSRWCFDPLVTNPTGDLRFTGRVLVAAGWKPGFSSDTDAVYLAERFDSRTVVNLSNIAKVYTADPRKDPTAIPLDTITWERFRTMVGDTWTPGKNVPFDPIASGKAQKLDLLVVCADGRNIDNTIAILEGKSFTGTVIGDRAWQ